MLAKRIQKSLAQVVRHQSRCFAAPDDKEKHAAEWGVKYNDECLKFEKEWEIIANKVMQDQAVYIENELGDL